MPYLRTGKADLDWVTASLIGYTHMDHVILQQDPSFLAGKQNSTLINRMENQ